MILASSSKTELRTLTVNFSNSPIKDIPLCLLILDSAQHLGNNTLSEIRLLTLLLLLLEACPAIEDGLHFCSKSNFLFLDEGV